MEIPPPRLPLVCFGEGLGFLVGGINLELRVRALGSTILKKVAKGRFRGSEEGCRKSG
jgi:hypothetical protein